MAAFVRPIFHPISLICRFAVRFFGVRLFEHRVFSQTSYILPALAVISCCAVFSGCTVKAAVENLTPTPFITSPNLLHPTELTPFDLAWAAPDITTHEYDTVVIEAVRVDMVDPENWLSSASSFLRSKDVYIEKINELAEYTQAAVAKEYENFNKDGIKVIVEKGAPIDSTPQAKQTAKIKSAAAAAEPLRDLLPRSGTLVVNISIAEANFGDPVVYGGLLAVPVPGAANLSTAVKSPSITLEARLTDQKTGEVLAELIDRRFPQAKIVDVNRLTVSSALRELVDSFADDLVASTFRKQDEKVRKRLPFSLIPW